MEMKNAIDFDGKVNKHRGARVQCGWSKFQELSHILTAQERSDFNVRLRLGVF